jgi:serine/threonine protein kinase
MQVLPALAYLHEQGIVHGDLQLSHLLLHGSGCIKLCGFGSAAQLPAGAQPCADVWCVAVLACWDLLRAGMRLGS